MLINSCAELVIQIYLYYALSGNKIIDEESEKKSALYGVLQESHPPPQRPTSRILKGN